jgi:hypothetical protein
MSAALFQPPVSASGKRNEPHERDPTLRGEVDTLVQIGNLAIVQQHKEAVAFECGNGFCELLLLIQHWTAPDSVEDSLGFFRLNKPVEYLVFRFIESRDFLLDSVPDYLAERQLGGIELK